MKIHKTLIDNPVDSDRGYNMTDALKSCLSDSNIQEVYIATGFWDLRGTELVFDELQEFLSREGSKLRILIGKDPYLYQSDTTEIREKGSYVAQERAWLVDMDNFSANEQYVKVVQMLVDNIKDKDNEKFQIHVYKPECKEEDQFLHSKCYIFKGEDKEENISVGYGIIGSSNFTKMGLEGNSELNTMETDFHLVTSLTPDHKKDKTHLMWFNEKWVDSKPWEEQFLLQVSKSKMGPVIKPTPPVQPEPEEQTPLTPYELYIKLLQKRFGNIVDKNLGEQIENYLPTTYDSYDYQIDAVKQCFSTMKEHGGFMLADVVGLGKTIVGTLLIKHFLQFPDEEGREQKVLIVTPPAIQSAWKRTIDEFDENSDLKVAPMIDYITTGSIGKLTDDELEDVDEGHDTGEFEEELKHENYGLIIIDESHKFRTSTTSMYEAIDTLIADIGSNIGVYPYIGLLSATPQNNRPSDLQNQIYLFERNHAESTLKKAKGGNLEGFFADVNRRFQNIMHPKDDDGNPITLTIEEINRLLKDLSLEIRDCILSDIMIRRTRTDVQKYYEKDKDQQKMHFPLIKGPISLEYKMSPTLARLFSDSMMNIAPTDESKEGLRYYRYRALQFLLKDEDKSKYKGKGSRDADKLSDQLANIMQIGLVKRLESSFTAFKQSLLNLRQYTQNMIDMWEHDCIFICPRINVNIELDRKAKEKKRGHKVSFAECCDDIRKKIEKLNKDGRNDDKSNMEYHCCDFDANYIDFLRYDLDIINDLCERWSMNSEDPKFDVFKEELKPVLFNKESNTPQKLVIFTEAIDTANSIASAAESKGFRVLLIKADNRDENEQRIRENFDANYKGEKKDEYDVIVTTDVLAEGINLHRANCILNYDTPWNSTRLMQRIGRVNRIGSSSDYVYVYNFMPSAQGDAEINLVQKAHNKLQSFHTLFGEDSQVFTDTEEVAHYDLNTEVNGEESPLEKYVYELKQYKDQHPERYAFIEQATENLQLATIGKDGTAYFLVRTPRMSGMFVKVTPTEDEGSVISLAEGLEAFRTNIDTQTVELPSSWEELSAEAERVVIAELASVRIMRSNSKKATDAKGSILELKKNPQISADSKKLLNAADKLIRQGNNDMVKRILKLAKEINDKTQLFQVTEEEFNKYINDGIATFVANAKDKHGKPEIILATYK